MVDLLTPFTNIGLITIFEVICKDLIPAIHSGIPLEILMFACCMLTDLTAFRVRNGKEPTDSKLGGCSVDNFKCKVGPNSSYK